MDWIIYFNHRKLQYRQMNGLKNNKKQIQHDNNQYLQLRRDKNKTNNEFNFLMKSIEREKFANLPQKENYKAQQGRYSTKMRPNLGEKSHMTSSTIVNSLFQGREQKEKEVTISVTLLESLILKIKKCLSLTESILQNPMKVEEKVKKQSINTVCELIELVTQVEQSCSTGKHRKQQSPYTSLNSTGNIVFGGNKSLSSSFNSPHGLASSFHVADESTNFMRKIENLEEEKMYLQSLISHHERANIKMFIKLNEGESEEIERYKKQLSSLFEKYKQLQKLVRKQSQKSKLLQIKLNQAVPASCGELCEMNTNEMKKKIESLQQIINQQNESLSFALEQIETLKQKLQKCEVIEPVLLDRGQGQRRYDKNKNSSRVSEFAGIDHSKSVFSQMLLQSTTDKSYLRNNTLDTQPYFSNISIKSSTSQSKIDENLMRMIFTQATALQAFIKI